MSRTIRIPNKVLIIIALILVVGGTAFAWGGDDALFAAGKALEAQGLVKESHAVYQALLSLYSNSEHRLEALVRMAKHLPPHSEGYFDGIEFEDPSNSYVPNWMVRLTEISMGSVRVIWKDDESLELVEQKIAYLEQALAEGSASGWRARALAELGYTRAALGQYQLATELLAEAWETPHYREENPRVGLWLARVYWHLAAHDEAEVVLREALEMLLKEDLEIEVRFELAKILEEQGRFDEIVEAWDPFVDRPEAQQQLERLRKSLVIAEGKQPAVIGEITLNGEGLPGVRVMLTHHQGGIQLIGSGRPIAETISDTEGRFELYDVGSGSYNVELFIPLWLAASSSAEFIKGVVEVYPGETAETAVHFDSRHVQITRTEIEDTEPYPIVHLAWEEFPGASSYYVVARGGVEGEYWIARAFDDVGWPVDGTSLAIPVDDLLIYPTGGSVRARHTNSVGELVLNLIPVLGLRHPGTKLMFQVQALDEEGNRLSRGRVICSDCGMQPQDMVELVPPRPALSDADYLLLEHRYDEAVRAYEEALAEDAYDRHSLFVLWYLLSYGVEGKLDPDPERTRIYGERLLELTEYESHRSVIQRSLDRL